MKFFTVFGLLAYVACAQAQLIPAVDIGSDVVSSASSSNNNVIAVVETIDDVETTVYYTIIEESTIVNDGASQDMWAPYPNLAQAMKNPIELENLIARLLKEKSGFAESLSDIINEASQSIAS